MKLFILIVTLLVTSCTAQKFAVRDACGGCPAIGHGPCPFCDEVE